MPTLAEQVGDAAGLLGLFLALVTLFTTEQSRRLADERSRPGGSRTDRLRTIRLFTIGLAAATVGSIAFLLPLFLDVLGTIGDDDWVPVLGVFILTYVLLIALLVWQLVLAAGTRKPA